MQVKKKKKRRAEGMESCAQLICVTVECTVTRLHHSVRLSSTDYDLENTYCKQTVNLCFHWILRLYVISDRNHLNVCRVLAISWDTHELTE